MRHILNTHITAAVMGVLLVLVNSANAETNTLGDLLVTARPINAQSLEHITQPTKILAGEELQRKQTSTIGETLANEPGVSASDFGQGASRPLIRGLGGPRLRILQNGLGSMDVSAISVDHAVSLNPLAAEQIEVVRGPATLLYGNGNSAGLVNVVTDRIPDAILPFKAKFFGQYETALEAPSVGVSLSGSPHQNLGLHLDAYHVDSEDYDAETGTIFNSETETDDISLGGSWIGDRGYIGFSYGRYETTYDIPFNPEEPDELVFIDLEQDRFDLAGELDDPVAGFNSIKFRAGYNDYTHTEFEGPGEPGTRFFNEEWETRLEAAHNSIGPLSGVIGLQYRDRDFVAEGDEAFVPATELDSIGVFVFEELDYQNYGHFEFGLRYEHQSANPDAASGFTEIDHDTYTLSFGGHWDLFSDYHLTLNLARSERAPSIEELFANGPHLATETFEVGNIDLDEEVSNNLDLSLSSKTGSVEWKTSVFVNLIEDYIYLQSQDSNNDGEADEVDEDGVLGAGDLLSVRYRQDDAVFYGFEAEAGMRLLENNFARLSARVFSDLVRAQLTNGDDLPRIPAARVGIGLEFQRQAFTANMDLINVFDQGDAADLETKTDGYVLLNTNLNYAFNQYGSVYLRGINLLDEDARRHSSFIKNRAPLVGQSIILGVRLQY